MSHSNYYHEQRGFPSYARSLLVALEDVEEISLCESRTAKGLHLNLKIDNSTIMILNHTMSNGDQVWYVPKSLLPAEKLISNETDFCTLTVNSVNSSQIIDDITNGILNKLNSEKKENDYPCVSPIFAKRMIGFRLANFKAFKEEQHIPIRPLTLIFGPNSGGKSSIIHGLIFANEAVRTGNLDVFNTQLGGDSIDLGGFRQYIHKGEVERLFDLSFRFSTEDLSHDYRMEGFDSYMGLVSLKMTVGMQLDYYGIPLEDGLPIIKSFTVEGDDHTLLRIKPRPDGFFCIDSIAWEHPMWRDIGNLDSLRNLENAKADLDQLRSLFKIPIPSLLPIGIEYNLDNSYSDKKLMKQFDWFITFVYTFVVELCRVVEGVLDCLQYLGPLRSYPSRDLVSKEHYDPNWFAGGGYAWDVVRKNADIREKINMWLGDSNKLRTSYEFISRDFQQVDSVNSDRTIQKLSLLDKRSGAKVTHRDVGIGISQVLPVLVSAYASREKIIAMEQPEIHLHPALQAELADVFIESAIGKNQNTFILETHSEHLILRILRRIRETAENELEEGATPITPDQVAVLYVQPGENGSEVIHIPVNEEGEFERPWPEGFFAERAKELF